MSRIFKGTVDACLADYLVRYPTDIYLEILAEYTRGRARDLKRRGVRLKGEKLLRAEVFLDLIGYHVVEYQRLHSTAQQLAQLIAFDITSLSEVADQLSYSNTASLLTVLLREGGMTRDRAYKLGRLVEHSKEELQTQLAIEREHLKPHFPTLADNHEDSIATDTTSRSRTASNGGSRSRRKSSVLDVPERQPETPEASVIIPQEPGDASPVPTSPLMLPAFLTMPATAVATVVALARILDAAAELVELLSDQPYSPEAWLVLGGMLHATKLDVLSDTLVRLKGEAKA